MKRRAFIATAVLGAAGIVGWRFFAGKDENAITKVLRKRLDYLTLDPAGVAQFAKDFAARKVITDQKLHAIDAAGVLYTGFALNAGNKLFYAIRHGEDRIISAYLISSDFFVNGADVTRVVKYLGYFDPLRACGNPFARPPETAAG